MLVEILTNSTYIVSGIHLTVFSICAYYLVLNIRYKRGDRNIHFLVYTFILFFLGTLIIAGNTKFAEEIWIDDRNVPGGPVAWLIEHYSDPANIMMCGSYVAANFFTDGILVSFLCKVTSIITHTLPDALAAVASVHVLEQRLRYYNSLRNLLRIYWYDGSSIHSTTNSHSDILAMSIMSVYFASRPGSSLWTPDTVKVTIAYLSMSIALNLILTILIVGRLLYLSRSVKAILGESHAKTYTSVAAMMIESAAPLSLTSIVFIITYGLDSNVQNLVLPILSQVLVRVTSVSRGNFAVLG